MYEWFSHFFLFLLRQLLLQLENGYGAECLRGINELPYREANDTCRSNSCNLVVAIYYHTQDILRSPDVCFSFIISHIFVMTRDAKE